MTTRRKPATQGRTQRTGADAAEVLRSLLDSIEREELAATGELVARLQGALAVLDLLDSLGSLSHGRGKPATQSRTQRTGADAAEVLRRVLAAFESGELDSPRRVAAGLNGALAALEPTTRVHDTTV